MVSSTTKLLVISSTAAAAVQALAPSVHHHGSSTRLRTSRAVPSGFSHHGGRFATGSRLIQGPHHRTISGSRDGRLSYQRLDSVDGYNATTTSPATTAQPLPLDFDQIEKLDMLNSRTQHAEVLGNEVISTGDDLSSPPSLALETSELDIQIQSRIENEKQEQDVPSSTKSSKGKSKSETRQMINEIASIAFPSLGGMLLDPIMSLIDTACVGQVSTTALAAMAPCTSIFQFAFFAFFFLSAATTNLVASNPPESVYDVSDTSEAAKRVDFNERVVSNAAGLALILGSLVTMGLIKFSDPLLKLAGIPATNTALLNAARPYLLIRALGLPFVFLATVLQGSSLGRGNAWRPLKIFGAAGVINLIGDIYLTLYKGWGATGAATATVAAQIGASLYYVISSARLEKSVEASSKPLRDVALVWRGLPSKKVMKTFMNVAMVLFSRSIGAMMAFSMLTRTAALGGELALAAHQVTLQVWWLLSFIPEPMSVAAQTLITRDMKDRKERVPKLVNTLYKMCGVLGISAAVLTGVILRAPAVAGALVADVSVQKMMASLVPFAVLSQSYCPIATLSDGVCIGLGSFSHLPILMAGSFLATAAGLAFVTSQNMGIVGVWACMNVFLTSRIVGHLLISTKLRKYIKKAFRREDKTPQVQAVPIPL